MTAPRVLSPEEWDATQKNRPLSPEEWDLKRQAMGGLGTRRIPLPSASGDVTREVGGVNDPERWKSAIHKQGTTEQLALGMVGLPFAAVKEPVQTAKAIAADVAQGFGIAKVGRGLSERYGHGAPALRKTEGGMLEPTREPVSDVEIAGALLNVAGLAAGSFKGQPKAAPVRTPRPGIVRVPAAEAAARLARVQGVGSLLERLRTPEAVDMAPQNVPLPPAARAYPFGATTGDLTVGGARVPFAEPAPTPFTRPGVRRLTEMPETAKPLPEGTSVSTEAARSAEDFAARVKAAADKAREARPATPEAFPEGFSTKSTRVTRRPASRVPSPEEWEAQQTAKQAESVPEPRAPEPVPVVTEPVSVGRDLAEPSRIPADAPKVPRPRGDEPSGIVETPEGVVSAGPRTLQPPQKKTLSPIGPRAVTAEQMLEVGKQRAAELEAGTVARSMPDLTPALKREGRMFGEPVTEVDPALPVEAIEPIKPKGAKKSEWKDLSETPDDVLRAESQRIKELHAQEEASVSFTQTPEWERWQNLPDKEKFGRSVRTTDEFGNVKKRQQEDLPDADASVDPDMLAEWRQTHNKYRQRTLVREAEVKRAAAIDAELERRASALEGMPSLPPAEHEAWMASVMAEAPDPRTAPREYLNYAKFGLDRATEARLRSTVEGLRKTGEVEKGYESFPEQQARADAFAKELVQNPLDIDRAKLAKLSGAEIVGLRTVASENTRLVEGLSRAIDSGDLSGAELTEANRLLDQAVGSTNELLGAIVRETAQKARDFGFLRQMAKLTTDPAVWVVRAKKLMGDRPLSDSMMIEIRRLAREASEACG